MKYAGDLIDLRLSSVDKKKKPNEISVRLCNYMDVYNNDFIHSNMSFMEATATENEITKCSLIVGDVVITKDSEKYDDIGVPALVREDIPNLVCGYHLAILRPQLSLIDGTYLFYALKTNAVQQQFHSFANGITRFGLRKSDICLAEIPLPSLPEQRAIAHILSTLDDKIELNRRMNETLEATARAIFKSWFVDFDPVRVKAEGGDPGLPDGVAALFPDSFEDSDLGKIPTGWDVKTIGDVTEFAYGKALKASDRKPGDVPVFGSNGQVGLHNEVFVKGPGIVVGRKGNPGIVTWSYEDFFPIDTTFYVKKTGVVSSLNYLFYALKSQDLPSLSADSAVPGLNRNSAYMSKFLVPPEKVLKAFDGQIYPFFQTNYANEKEIKTLAFLRDTVLPKLISGELRVRDAEKFVEEAGI